MPRQRVNAPGLARQNGAAMQAEPTIPHGYCQCGCGQRTNLAQQTSRRFGWKQGEPLKYIVGHAPSAGRALKAGERKRRLTEHRKVWEDAGIEYGHCLCGCGERTPISVVSNRGRPGWISGEPRFWLEHHDKYSAPDAYVAEDRGHETPCWIWQRHIDPGGYGRCGKGLAHRWHYERHYGPVPDGLHVDHLCSQRACVNPEHLEAVTQQENNRRSHQRKRDRLELRNG